MGVGDILSQHQGTLPQLFSCTDFSRELSPTEKYYDTADQDVLEKWRHWLEGAPHLFAVDINLEDTPTSSGDC